MAQTGTLVSSAFVALLNTESSGLGAAVADLALREDLAPGVLLGANVRTGNISADLAERTVSAQYPAIHVYCERVTNTLREKFRTFSGTVRMTAEIRVSRDRIEHMEEHSHLFADAVTAVLDSSRGDWGSGMFYSGGYEIVYGPVRQGGKHFLQITKVSFEVDVSTN